MCIRDRNKVISREFPEAARETLLVLDATTGKNAVSQAQEFNDVAEITGVVLTKLDGTAKGCLLYTSQYIYGEGDRQREPVRRTCQ